MNRSNTISARTGIAPIAIHPHNGQAVRGGIKSKGTRMTKSILEQRDRYNQRLTLSLEMANGEQAQPMIYLRGLLKTQSLEAWNGKQDEFRDWIAEQMADYFKRIEVRIWGHSNTDTDPADDTNCEKTGNRMNLS